MRTVVQLSILVDTLDRLDAWRDRRPGRGRGEAIGELLNIADGLSSMEPAGSVSPSVQTDQPDAGGDSPVNESSQPSEALVTAAKVLERVPFAPWCSCSEPGCVLGDGHHGQHFKVDGVPAPVARAFDPSASSAAADAADKLIGAPQVDKLPPRDQLMRWLHEERGVDDPCQKCHGTGVFTYPNTATWRKGGLSGQAFTDDVCDACWGTGDEHRHGADLRKLHGHARSMELKLKALEARLAAEVEGERGNHGLAVDLDGEAERLEAEAAKESSG